MSDACKVLLLRIFQDLEIFAHSEIFLYNFFKIGCLKTEVTID